MLIDNATKGQTETILLILILKGSVTKIILQYFIVLPKCFITISASLVGFEGRQAGTIHCKAW